MNQISILRCLVATEALLGLIGIVADSAGERLLPIEIQQYLARSINADLTSSQATGLGLGVLVVIGVIVGWIGLWRLWRPARLIYTVSWLGGVPLILLLDPVVYYTPIGAMFSEYSILAAGAILGVIFFSDLAEHFGKTKA